MPNTSATGGYLSPSVSPAPAEDNALEDIVQAILVAISGLPGAMVRPRWQPKPPKVPEATVNWCAFGVTVQDAPGLSPAIKHNVGSDSLERNEDLAVLVSFYGPASQAYASRVREGLAIPQNCEAMQLNLMRFINSDTIRQVPELVNEQWVKRQDLPLHFRRRIVREYAVLSIVSADSEITSD